MPEFERDGIDREHLLILAGVIFISFHSPPSISSCLPTATASAPFDDQPSHLSSSSSSPSLCLNLALLILILIRFQLHLPFPFRFVRWQQKVLDMDVTKYQKQSEVQIMEAQAQAQARGECKMPERDASTRCHAI